MNEENKLDSTFFLGCALAVITIFIACCLCGCGSYRSPYLQRDIDSLKLEVGQLAGENEYLKGKLTDISTAGEELANGSIAISDAATDDIGAIRTYNQWFRAEFERLYQIIRSGDSKIKEGELI
jgi:hypothetical protein